jgi:single-strand DNA-binding protein
MTRDADIRYTSDKKAVARFSLAITRDYDREKADFLNCVAFGKTAEVIEKYTHKGSRIGITGRIETGSYEKDGRKVYTTDIIVNNVELMDSKKDESDGFNAVEGATEEQLPFV